MTFTDNDNQKEYIKGYSNLENYEKIIYYHINIFNKTKIVETKSKSY